MESSFAPDTSPAARIRRRMYDHPGRSHGVQPDVVRSNVLRRYPGFIPADVVYGSGPGFAETYFSDDPGAPYNPNRYFGRDTVELRRNLPQPEQEGVLKGELLHFMSRNPKFSAARDGFMGSLSQRQLSILRDIYKNHVKRFGEDRGFDKWLEYTGKDMLVRGYLSPDRNDEFRPFYEPQNKPFLEDMMRVISGG